MIDCANLKKLMRYDPDSGDFTWLYRDASPANNRWNGKNAGRIAGWINNDGYLIIELKEFGKFKAHRLAWLYVTGRWPDGDIDHKNRNRLDNSWNNLREATRSQNNANSKLNCRNTSGLRGVSYDKANKKWRCHLSVNGVLINGKRVDTPEEASIERDQLTLMHFGEFATLNGGLL